MSLITVIFFSCQTVRWFPGLAAILALFGVELSESVKKLQYLKN